MARRKGRNKGLTQHSGRKFYTTDTGYRMAFDIQNRIDTGDDWSIPDEATRRKQQGVLDLLEMGSSPQGVSPTQWVGFSGRDHRLNINQSMAVFDAAVEHTFLSDNPRDAHSDTATRRPIDEGDEPFGPWDL